MKKLEMVLGGIELLAALGVSTLVGGALVLVTPVKLGAIKKIAVGIAGVAISCLATDTVTNYMDKQFKEILEQFKDVFKKKTPKEATVEVEGA